MSFVFSALLSAYFCSLIAFSFVTHPVAYCFLLMISAFSAAGCIFSALGFGWYLVLFCLVYVGGVYVLFIFVSLHSPNPTSGLGGGGEVVFLFFILLLAIFLSMGLKLNWSLPDTSHYLCSYYEGISYCLFCLILMLGFVVVSVVTGDKDSFFR